jgi:uncharacterized protein
MSQRVVMRLDPWPADYESALQLPSAAEAPPPAVDTTVETTAFLARRPEPAARAERLLFVDGVRRVEQRLLIDGPRGTVFGLLGSLAVGAVETAAMARVVSARVRRVICSGDGMLLDPFEGVLRHGPARLCFDPVAAAENTPMAPLAALQNEMRREEGLLAIELAASGAPVLLDGPLSFVSPAAGAVLGIVKRLQQIYLPAREAALLPALEVGERTPLFLIAHARHPRYSCYLRLARGRAIDAALAGLIRIEADTTLGLDETVRLADLAARELPRFASDAAHDPRAPQNLYPVGGLEVRLRHLMGDAFVIRRAIERYMARELAS